MQQGRHQVGEGLADAGTGLHYQDPIPLVGLAHLERHLQLSVTILVAMEPLGKGPSLVKYLIHLFFGHPDAPKKREAACAISSASTAFALVGKAFCIVFP